MAKLDLTFIKSAIYEYDTWVNGLLEEGKAQQKKSNMALMPIPTKNVSRIESNVGVIADWGHFRNFLIKVEWPYFYLSMDFKNMLKLSVSRTYRCFDAS